MGIITKVDNQVTESKTELNEVEWPEVGTLPPPGSVSKDQNQQQRSIEQSSRSNTNFIRNNQKTNGNRKGNKKYGQRDPIQCYSCGQMGHKSTFCSKGNSNHEHQQIPAMHHQNNNDNVTNDSTGYQNTTRNFHHQSKNGPVRHSSGKRRIICNICQEPGHIAPVCPRKPSHHHQRRNEARPALCRYWLNGHCHLGEKCMFTHGFIPNTVYPPNVPYHDGGMVIYPPPQAAAAGGWNPYQYIQQMQSAQSEKPTEVATEEDSDDTTSSGVAQYPAPYASMNHQYAAAASPMPHLPPQHLSPMHYQYHQMQNIYYQQPHYNNSNMGVVAVPQPPQGSNEFYPQEQPQFEESAEQEVLADDDDDKDSTTSSSSLVTDTEEQSAKEDTVAAAAPCFGDFDIKENEEKEGSSSSPVGKRGLTNLNGQNSCFLNVVVQALFHSAVFRSEFESISEECVEDTKKKVVLKSLKKIFADLEKDDDESVVSSESLRTALSDYFQNDSRFSVGAMDDAVEARDMLLWTLHSFQKHESECTSSDLGCVSHRSFGMYVTETGICNRCDYQTSTVSYDTMNLYVLTNVLVSLAEQSKKEERLSFESLVKQSLQGDSKKCENSKCRRNDKDVLPISYSLDVLPSVLTLGMTYSRANPTATFVSQLLGSISETLDLTSIFDSIGDRKISDINSSSRDDDSCKANLMGMFCYFGRHYVAFFYNSLLGQWQYFNDASVIPVGAEFKNVIKKCIEENLQPSMLFYETPKESTAAAAEKTNTSESEFQFTIGDIVVQASTAADSTWKKETLVEESTSSSSSIIPLSFKENNFNRRPNANQYYRKVNNKNNDTKSVAMSA